MKLLLENWRKYLNEDTVSKEELLDLLNEIDVEDLLQQIRTSPKHDPHAEERRAKINKILSDLEARAEKIEMQRRRLETMPIMKQDPSDTAAMAQSDKDINRLKTALNVIMKNPTILKSLLSPEDKETLKAVLAEELSFYLKHLDEKQSKE